MKKKRKLWKWTVGVLLFFLMLLPPVWIQAKGYKDSNPDDYVTKEFNVTVEFDRSHTASVTEEIQVDFKMSHHGITRNIPAAKDSTYEVKNISVENYKYNVEESDDNTVIRIGDEDRYLTGEQTYKLHYQIEYYKDLDEKADFLAQNMLPTEWETSIRSSRLTLIMPEKIDLEHMQIYAGKYGVDDLVAWKEKFKLTCDGNTLVLTGKKLPKGYGVTLRDPKLSDGYWSEAESFLDSHKKELLTIKIIAAICGVLPVFLWILYGRDKKIVEVVEFYPPDQMTPAEVGYALDEELEDSEMMTMVFYLADKGYLTIEQEKKHFILHKEKEPVEEEPDFVRTFFKGLFKKKDNFHTAKPPGSFRKLLDKSKQETIDGYQEKYGEVYSRKSSLSRYACILFMAVNMAAFCMILDETNGAYVALVLAVLSGYGMMRAWKGFDNIRTKRGAGAFRIVTGGILYAACVLVIPWLYNFYPVRDHVYAFLISQTVIFLFSFIMQRRSGKGTEIMGRLYGFRRFIKEAEYDRIVALSEEDPEYFYHILPYAAVLGLETAWTKHFEKIKIPKPDWYRSEDAAFLYSSVWCSRMIDSCTRTAVPPAPSSGSSGGYSGGSSGGGFSGGGGGGGGGGAW